MLKSILPKLTRQERVWLQEQLAKKRKRGRGKPKKVEQEWQIYWEVLAVLEANKWARGAMKKAIGTAAAKHGVSDKTIERIIDADLKRRQSWQPGIDRMFERLERAGITRRRQ